MINVDSSIVDRKASASTIRTTLSFTGLSALSGIIDITDDVGEAGIQWATRTIAGHRIGAGGHVTMYDLPEVYTCTLNFAPDTKARLAMDLFVALTSQQEGVNTNLNAFVTITETNTLTNETKTYLKGQVETDPSGDSYARDGGQSDRSYDLAFKNYVMV